jgi:hypothetical protein
MDVIDRKDVQHETRPTQKSTTQNQQESRETKSKRVCCELFPTHPCADCGESDPVVLTFDHVRGTKRGNVSDMVRDGLGLETIKAEMEKCDVVCYNCHSLRTQERSGAYRWRMGKRGRE